MPLPPRILFVTESFDVGGTETHLLNLLPELKDKGFEVAAFCFTRKGSRADRLESVGIPVYAAPQIGDSKRSLLTPVRLAGGAARLFRSIRHFRPSIVHFFLPGAYLPGAPVALAAGVPIKIMSRRSLNDYQRGWPGAATAEKFLHRRMDMLLGNARAITHELIQEGVPEKKVRLIYNGIHVPAMTTTKKEARAALDIDEHAFVAVVVANLLPYKGHLDLIAALIEIADGLPQPWTVLLAGRDGGSRAEIERAIVQGGLANHVRLLGERNDVPRILAAADVGILTPTRNEGLSNAILEFMAAGLPMVVTDVGGNAEVVVEGQTGLVVPPHDPKRLGDAILDLAQDPGRRKAMGDAARKRLAEEFSLTACVDRYYALYEHLLSETEPDTAKPMRDQQNQPPYAP
jgi:glycosyltransferase involved in cell wall biosynthesis